MPSTTAIVALATAFLAVILYQRYVQALPKDANAATIASLPLPPGPKGVPVLGMTAKVMAPGKKHASLFEDWEKQYGQGKGILLVPTLFRQQIIISDAKAAQALLEKRGTAYAWRAPNYFFDKLRGAGLNLVAMEGGPAVEAVRKLFHEQMSTKAVQQWTGLQASNAAYTSALLLRMEGKDTVADVVEKTQKELTIRTFCGKLPASTWKNITEIEAQIDAFRTPAIAPLLDLFPAMKSIPEYLPGGGYKEECRRYAGLNKLLWDELREQVRQQVAAGQAETSVWGNLMQTNAFARHGFSEDEASYIMGHQLGSNFVPAALFEVFFLAMLHFPNVLKQAQAEIDAVIGRDRLPTLEDEASLPFIRALQLELLRWRPVVPLVQPHIAAEEDSYNGVRIPKGSLVWANLQAMSRDERTYEKPEQFMPERFLSTNAQGERVFSRKDEISIFGYGRRRCPGAYLADPILFLNLATFVWALHIESVSEDAPLPSADVETWYTYITFVVPPPFKAKVTPRDANVSRLLREGAGDWLLETEA